VRRILAKSGELLTFCDARKQEWYVGRGLAEWVDGAEAPTVRLLFEHSTGGPAEDAQQFYSHNRHNCCVGCGEAQHLQRYR